MNTGYFVRAGCSLSILCFSFGPFAGAAEYIIDSSKSEAQFLAVGKPGFLKIRGQGATLEGRLEIEGVQVSGELSAGLQNLKTGISLRDEHMHEKYLESQKFPTAALKITKVSFEKGSSGNCSFEGSLEIKGTIKPVSGSCEASSTDDLLSATAKTEFKIADFPIGIPSHLGITVAEKVELTVTIFAVKTPESK